MAKIPKSVWLSEQQIGDILWSDFDGAFGFDSEPKKLYREQPIGNGRIDFMSISERCIELYELKITANLDSVVQLVKYHRDLNEYIRQVFYCDSNDHEKVPQVQMNLMARYFDARIMELCTEFQIGLWRVDVISEFEIAVELDNDFSFPVVPDKSRIRDLLISEFGVIING